MKSRVQKINFTSILETKHFEGAIAYVHNSYILYIPQFSNFFGTFKEMAGYLKNLTTLCSHKTSILYCILKHI